MASSLTYRDVIWWMMEAPNDLAKKYNFITFIILSNHGIQQKFLQINKTDFKVYRSMSVHFYNYVLTFLVYKWWKTFSISTDYISYWYLNTLSFVSLFSICFCNYLNYGASDSMCLLSSVTFWYHLFLKDHVWFLYCSLKVGKSNVFSFVGWQSLLGK